MYTNRVTLGGTVIGLALIGSAFAAPPPAEVFGALPFLDHVEISPVGDHYAAIQWDKGSPHLAVYDLRPAADPKVRFLKLEIRDRPVTKVRRIHWLNDGMIGVVIEFDSNERGAPTTETRLIAVRRDLGKNISIPRPASDALFRSQFQHRILDDLPEDPQHILMEFDPEGRGKALSACKVDVETGTFSILAAGGEYVAGYQTDQQGQVRLRYEIRPGTKQIRIRNVETDRWELFEEVDRQGSFELRPLAFTADGQGLWVFKQNERGLDEIFEFDLRTRKLGQRVLTLGELDVHGVETDPYTRGVVAASYAEHFPTRHYFDEALAKIQRAVDAALPDSHNSILNYDRRRSRFVVLASGPRLPGRFYLYVTADDSLLKIGDIYKTGLEPEQLCDVTPLTYEARDGLSIPAYLTRPERPGPLPMVVLPHGGPTERDFQGFDYIAQFLATRGYAVLQPNFRGSSGYGALFQSLGHEQWGLAMQDDVTDGVKAMIERGIADPERICIVGWSYGGYAALMGAIRTPDLYRCAVAGAAVTDIRKMLAEVSRYKFATINQPSVGHYWNDRRKLRDNSPINNADEIQVPVLLIHGDADVTVPVAHSKRMQKKLKSLNKPHRLVLLEDEDHHLSMERNRVLMLAEVETFLAEHIGGDGQAAPDAGSDRPSDP